MRHRIPRLLFLAVAIAAVPAPSAVARVECSAQTVESFDVTARPHQRVYRIGETAVVDITVKDSLTGAPATDVDAGLFIRDGGRRGGRDGKAVFGYGKTNTEGRTTVRMPLRRSSVRPGWIRVWVVAYEAITTPAYCAGRYGEREYKRFFRIRG